MGAATRASSIARPETPDDVGATLDSSVPAPAAPCQPRPPGRVLDLGLAVAGQLAQLPDRPGRHEAGADQPVLDQLGDPGRVGHVGLPPRDVVQVGRVQQPALHLALEQLPDRLPVAPGRLHPHPGHPEAGQPLGQQPQPGGRRGEPAGLAVAPGVAVRHPHTGGYRVLARPDPRSVRPASPPACLLHLDNRIAAIRRSLYQRNLRLVLVATVRGARGSHLRGISGLSAPRSGDVGRMSNISPSGWPDTP